MLNSTITRWLNWLKVESLPITTSSAAIAATSDMTSQTRAVVIRSDLLDQSSRIPFKDSGRELHVEKHQVWRHVCRLKVSLYFDGTLLRV